MAVKTSTTVAFRSVFNITLGHTHACSKATDHKMFLCIFRIKPWTSLYGRQYVPFCKVDEILFPAFRASYFKFIFTFQKVWIYVPVLMQKPELKFSIGYKMRNTNPAHEFRVCIMYFVKTCLVIVPTQWGIFRFPR